MIDDDSFNGTLFEASLRKEGLRRTLAKSGEQGLKWLAQRRSDLVLLDLGPLGMPGLEVLRHSNDGWSGPRRADITVKFGCSELTILVAFRKTVLDVA